MKLGDTPINNIGLIDLHQEDEYATGGGRYLECNGMTLRQHYAGLAMQSLLPIHWDIHEQYESASDLIKCISEAAVEQADALLAELEKELEK